MPFKRNTIKQRMYKAYEDFTELYSVPEMTFHDFIDYVSRNVVSESIFECYEADYN